MENRPTIAQSLACLDRGVSGNFNPTRAENRIGEVLFPEKELTCETISGLKGVARRPRRSKGFTLMEVVVTLGILALFIGVLALFPQLMNVSAESTTETRAAHIADQIIRDLVPALSTLPSVKPESTGPDGHPPSTVPYGRVVTQVTAEGGEFETVDFQEASLSAAWFSLEGQPVPETDPSARLKAEIKITPEPGRTGFCQVEVRVRSLSAAATVPAHRFFTKVAFPRKETPSA